MNENGDSIPYPIVSPFSCFNAGISSLYPNKLVNLTKIAEYSFSCCFKLTEVVLPASIEEICEGSFQCCSSLARVSFVEGSNLKTIGKFAFRCCESLKTFDFPSLLERIENKAFNGCLNLKIVDLSATKIYFIGKSAFSKFLLLIIPSTLVSIDMNIKSYGYVEIDKGNRFIQSDSNGYLSKPSGIFYCNFRKSHFLIRRSVERILDFCFYGSPLVRITIPDSVVKICKNAFGSCGNLSCVRFHPNSRLEIIEKAAFSNCLNLERISLPKSLRIIKESAFHNCSLKRIIFQHESRLEEIYWPFTYTKIEKLYLPSSVKRIVNVVKEMFSLESVHISNNYFQSTDDGTAIYSKDGNDLVCVLSWLKQIQISQGTKVIKEKAIDCMNMDDLIIPASVEVIEANAISVWNVRFEEGTRIRSIDFNAFSARLTSLQVNNSNFRTSGKGVVTSINPRGIVFVPRNLKEIEIDQELEVIYSYAFFYSKIKNITFPPSLKKICTGAFQISEIETIEFSPGTVLNYIEQDAFNSSVKKLKLPLVNGKVECFVNRNIDLEFPAGFAPCEIDKSLFKEHQGKISVTYKQQDIKIIGKLLYNKEATFSENNSL